MNFIWERNLGAVGGHQGTVVKALRFLFPQLNARYVVAYEEGSASEAGSDYVPILSPSGKLKVAMTKSLAADSAAVAGLIATLDPTQLHKFLIPTANAIEIRVCLGVVALGVRNVRFFCRALGMDTVDNLNEAERAALHRAIADGQVQLITEARELTDHLAKSEGIAAPDDLLLPCMILPDQKMPERSGAEGKHIYRLGYLGAARGEKGRDMVPPTMRALMARMRQHPRPYQIELTIQWATRHRGMLSAWLYRRRMARLFKGAMAGTAPETAPVVLRILPTILDGPDFIDLFAELDALFLPYDDRRYRNRGSGMIIDSTLAGLPFVYRPGLAMQRYQTAGNAEGARTAEGLADAVLKVFDDYDRYVQGVQTARLRMEESFTRAVAFLACFNEEEPMRQPH